MLERNLIEAVDTQQKSFEKKFNTHNLYRFFMDRLDIADNQVKKWKNTNGGKPLDPIEVSKKLVTMISEVYQTAIVEDEDED